MIIIRLYEILRHPNICIKAKRNMAAAYFCSEIAISFERNLSSGIKQFIGLYGGYKHHGKFLTSIEFDH